MMFMYSQVGIAYLAGFLIIVLMGLVGFFLSRYMNYYDNKVTKKKDSRIKQTNEIFSNIKVIKMNGWENLFKKRLNDFYTEEAETIKSRSRSEICVYSMMMLTPNFITIAVFVFFIHVHGGGVNPTKAFALIAAFFILQNPMREFSEFLIKYGDGMKSIMRIQKFLLSEEIDTSHIDHKTDQN
jgi:ATP-binding cassette subfamily C (CFTR/MRP) protein 1